MDTLNNKFNVSLRYAELSQRFKESYPTVVRAFQLIGQMYNRLTLVDGLTHREAIKKIYNDHKDLQGFSRRNIYRYLPTENSIVPRRVMTQRHKSSGTESISAKNIGITKLIPPREISKTIDEVKIPSVEVLHANVYQGKTNSLRRRSQQIQDLLHRIS